MSVSQRIDTKVSNDVVVFPRRSFFSSSIFFVFRLQMEKVAKKATKKVTFQEQRKTRARQPDVDTREPHTSSDAGRDDDATTVTLSSAAVEKNSPRQVTLDTPEETRENETSPNASAIEKVQEEDGKESFFAAMEQAIEEDVKTAFGSAPVYNTVRDATFWGKIDVNITPFRYAYKYGIAFGEDFMNKHFPKDLDVEGMFIVKIAMPSLNYFFSLGHAGFFAYSNEPVQIKHAPVVCKQEHRRLSRFLHMIDPKNEFHLRPAWYFIDAEKANAAMIKCPDADELRRLDAKVKKDINEEFRQELKRRAYFKMLLKKEWDSVIRKRKILSSEGAKLPPIPEDGTLPPEPKRSKLAELRRRYVNGISGRAAAVTRGGIEQCTSMSKIQRQLMPLVRETTATTITTTTTTVQRSSSADKKRVDEEYDDDDLMESISGEMEASAYSDEENGDEEEEEEKKEGRDIDHDEGDDEECADADRDEKNKEEYEGLFGSGDDT